MKPEELLFSKTHEWVHIDEESGATIATVGISKFAVEALTDLVFMQLPELGRRVRFGDALGEIESVKAVSDLYSPVDGEVIEVNKDLPNHLETLAQDPYGAGWLVKIKTDTEATAVDLLDYRSYQKQCAEEQH